LIPFWLERDFVGYGGNPPDARWRSGARIALNFVLNYEEGSEYSIMDKDGVSDAALTELPSAAAPPCRAATATSQPKACSNTAAVSASGVCTGSSRSETCR
jgi:hypothetical protein